MILLNRQMYNPKHINFRTNWFNLAWRIRHPRLWKELYGHAGRANRGDCTDCD
jgi:hypothetical protein